MRLVVQRGAGLAAGSITIGLLIATAAARWVQPLLFRQSAKDPAAYGLVAITMLVAALAASAIPAYRASRADPNTALRAD
jgi:ABC-type antimicrobial peptide transport system permease subunit